MRQQTNGDEAMAILNGHEIHHIPITLRNESIAREWYDRLKQKIEQPKEVKAADKALEQTTETLDVDLDTSDLDQDIDALL